MRRPGCPVANSGVTDVAHQGRQHRQLLSQSGRAGDFGVGRTRSNRDRAIMELDLLRDDASDVDQAGWCMSATPHIPKQGLAAGEQHGPFSRARRRASSSEAGW